MARMRLCTYFHSREWAEIWHEYTDGRIRPHGLKVRFNDGKSAVLALSREKQSRGLLVGYLSSPAGTFGGWITDCELTQVHVDLMAQYILSGLNNLTWRINPYQNPMAYFELQFTNDRTYAIHLGDGFELLYRKWSKGHRAAAKQAANYGVAVRIASSLVDWQSYYKIYEDSMRRWGNRRTSAYDWRLFEVMFELDSNSIRLWLADYQGNVVAERCASMQKDM